jgi:hypothetical protein
MFLVKGVHLEERNPYAAPKAQIAAVRETRCTRDGKYVLVAAGSDLPPRCIVCNAPASQPIKEVRVYWHSPWYYLLIPINFLLYVLVAVLARRSVTISPGFCPVHGAKRRRRTLMFTLAGGGSVALGLFLLWLDQAGGALSFFLISLVILVVGVFFARKVYAKRITKECARVGGCKEPFLSSLE